MASRVENEGAGRQQRHVEVFPKNEKSFMGVTREEVQDLKSVKVQYGLIAKFHKTTNEEVEKMEHYFKSKQPIMINEHNIDALNHVFNSFVEEVKGDIEAWSGKGSGLWIKYWRQLSTWRNTGR